MGPDDLLTTTQAGAVLHVTARQVGNYVAKGLLPAVRFGKRTILIPAAALVGFTPPPVGPPRKETEMNTTTKTQKATRFLVWGCGAWPERRQVVDAEEPMDCVTEDMPEFDLLPAEFVAEWTAAPLGSEHWAEIVTCDESDLDAATRFSPNIYGFKSA